VHTSLWPSSVVVLCGLRTLCAYCRWCSWILFVFVSFPFTVVEDLSLCWCHVVGFNLLVLQRLSLSFISVTRTMICCFDLIGKLSLKTSQVIVESFFIFYTTHTARQPWLGTWLRRAGLSRSVDLTGINNQHVYKLHYISYVQVPLSSMSHWRRKKRHLVKIVDWFWSLDQVFRVDSLWAHAVSDWVFLA